MKKHQEGYVLIYVLVVIVCLSALAIGVFSHALSNLKAQEATAAYEQEKYEAEGRIERFVTELSHDPSLISADRDTLTEEYGITIAGTGSPYTLTAVCGSVQVTAVIEIRSGSTVRYVSFAAARIGGSS